ncbi:MAG TPA: GlsB/YeaQ/YmgE family stress response membrane protein [Chitinophagaceae bacterium]|nr:GlsB/YeaQ/YmgE family stress response membrane protein [Chitinophagaceae bacterium]
MSTLIHLLLGGIAGWLAGKVMRGDGYGVIIDIILGLLGGWVGGFIGEKLGISLGGNIGYLITAFLGAVLLVWVSRLIKGKA